MHRSFRIASFVNISALVLLCVVALGRTSVPGIASGAVASIDGECSVGAKLAESAKAPSDNVAFLERRSLDPNGSPGNQAYGPWVKVASPTPHPGESPGTEGLTAVMGTGGALLYAVESMVGNPIAYDACYRDGKLLRARRLRRDAAASPRVLRVVYYDHGTVTSDSAPNDPPSWDPSWFTGVDAERRSFFPALAIPLGRL